MRLTELAPVIRRRPPRDEPVAATLLLGTEDDADAVLAYFAADRSRRVVRLVTGGRPQGFIVRTDLYALFPTSTKWVDPEVPRGSGRGCVLKAGEVNGAGGVEGFLWGACWEAGAQDRVFVAFAGGGVDREAEGVG